MAVGLVGRDEGGDGDDRGIGKELRNFGNAANVLVTVLLGEPEVLVESEADIVACEFRLVFIRRFGGLDFENIPSKR